MRGDLAVKLKSMVSRATECEMKKKRKNMICSMRKPCCSKRLSVNNGCVGRDESDEVFIQWNPANGPSRFIYGLTSRDARLLAKRINQFLDAGG